MAIGQVSRRLPPPFLVPCLFAWRELSFSPVFLSYFVCCLEVVTLVSRGLGSFFFFGWVGFSYIFLERLVVGIGVLRKITCK